MLLVNPCDRKQNETDLNAGAAAKKTVQIVILIVTTILRQRKTNVTQSRAELRTKSRNNSCTHWSNKNGILFGETSFSRSP